MVGRAKSRAIMGSLAALVVIAALIGALVQVFSNARLPDPIDRAANESLESCGDFERLHDLKVFAKHDVPRGTLAFYEGRCARMFGRGDRVYGYVLVHKSGEPSESRWSRAGSLTGQNLVDFETVFGCGVGECDASAYGLVSPDVAIVEITVGNGQSDRVKPTGSVFALTASGTEVICELRLFNAAGEKLQSNLLSESGECAR